MTDRQWILTAAEIPEPAGYWVIGENLWRTRLAMYQKPMWLHRKLTTLLLGWEWEDNG